MCRCKTKNNTTVERQNIYYEGKKILSTLPCPTHQITQRHTHSLKDVLDVTMTPKPLLPFDILREDFRRREPLGVFVSDAPEQRVGKIVCLQILGFLRITSSFTWCCDKNSRGFEVSEGLFSLSRLSRVVGILDVYPNIRLVGVFWEKTP